MMMRFFGMLAVLVFMAATTAAVPAQSPAPVTSAPKKVTVRYLCGGLKVTAVYDNVRNRVSFVWGAKDNHLPHVASADGARYANDRIEWWEKGDDVTLSSLPEHNVLTKCTVRK